MHDPYACNIHKIIWKALQAIISSTLSKTEVSNELQPTMSTIQSRHPPQCQVASLNSATTVEQFYEPQAAAPRRPCSIPASELQHNLDRWAERNQSLVITAVGKSGGGTSTMINHFLNLRHDKMSPTGDDVDPITTQVSNYRSRIKIKFKVRDIGAQTSILHAINYPII